MPSRNIAIWSGGLAEWDDSSKEIMMCHWESSVSYSIFVIEFHAKCKVCLIYKTIGNERERERERESSLITSSFAILNSSWYKKNKKSIFLFFPIGLNGMKKSRVGERCSFGIRSLLVLSLPHLLNVGLISTFQTSLLFQEGTNRY